MGNNASNPSKVANTSNKAGVVVASMNQTMIVILAVAAMLLLVLIVVYIVSLIKKNKLSSVILHDKVIQLDSAGAVPYVIESSKMGLPSVGQEFSYSLWLYLGNNYSPTIRHKLIFQRGNTSQEKDGFTNQTNPIIFMDKSTNRLYVAMSTTNVNTDHTLDQIIQRNAEGKFTSQYLISYIDYVPLQRWVNVTVVSKDNMMMVFFDGDLYSATSVSDISFASKQRPVIRSTRGEAIIGDSQYQVQGYISHSQFFNYALSQREVTKIYNTGPNKKSILSFIGLDKYGVRSPVYNIEDGAK